MTYNIRTYDGPDSIWDGITGDYNGWEGREPKYALETITELMPDIVGLQEDDQYLYDEYSKVPALEANYVRYNAGGNGNENNEILVKKGITVLESGTVYYKEYKEKHLYDENISGADWSADTKGDSDKGRFFRWVLVEKNGVKFLVVNTHLHYTASDTSSSDAINKNLRKGQATLIRLWLAENIDKTANQIVMGDMNAQGDAQEMKYGLLNGTGSLDLASANATLKGDVGGTLIGDSFTNRQPWVYDHIFFNGDVLTADEYSVIDNYDAAPAPTKYPSDHLPVVAKFTCTAA